MPSMHRWDLLGGLFVVLFAGSLWALLSTAPERPPADAQLLDPSSEVQLGDEWLGLYFKGERVGLMHMRKRAREGGGYHFSLRTSLRLLALNSDAPLDTQVEATLDGHLTLQRFTFSVDAGPARFSGTGDVEGKVVKMKLRTGGETVAKRLELEHAPVLKANLGPLLSRDGLKPGARMRYHAFDPLTQRDQPVDVEVVGPDTVVAFGREVPVTHIRQTISGMTLDGWINQRGEMLRQELGLGLVARRESEEEARWGLAQARSGRSRADLAEATMIDVGGLPPRLDRGRRLVLSLDGVDMTGFALGDARQTYEGDRLTIARETPGDGVLLPVTSGVPAETLAADALIQADHPRIREAARSAIGDAKDTVEAADRLRRWVHGRIEQTLVVGVPSALETLDSGIGDCNEHATLFAALGRSVGLPTQMAVGLVYRDGRFGYHAWNEVWTQTGWLTVDPTWDQMPVDVGHLRIVRGGLDRQVEMLGVIGRLELKVVSFE